jgi:hypothetical protein
MVGSASATFPPPNPLNGWYTTPSVSGSVDFVSNDHEGVENVTCRLSNNTIVGQFVGQSFDFVGVPVTVFGDSTDVPGLFSPVGFQRETAVTCTGTLLEQNQICVFGFCTYIPGSYSPAGPAVARAFLHIDHSPPVNVTAIASADPNANGWYNAPATVSFSGSDPNSGTIDPISHINLCHSGSPFGPGVAGQSIGPPDGSFKQIFGGCANAAGLRSGVTLVYYFDGTKPIISAAATTLPNSNGWYNGNVEVAFTCSDNLSGIASCPANESLSSEGAAVASTAQTATDQADNVSDPSNIVEVKIDKTAPTITVPASKTVNATSPAGATVNYSGDVSASDALSDVASSGCLPASGSVFPIGSTTVTCNATDKAGNSATPKSFTVQVNGAAAQLSALLAAVTNVAPGSSMADKLKQIQGYVAINDKASACSGLTNFISLVKAQSGKKLTAAQATSFIAQANNIRATLGC